MEYLRTGESDDDALFKIAIENGPSDRPSLIEFYTTNNPSDSNYKKVKCSSGEFSDMALLNGYKIGSNAIDNATTLLRN